MCNNCISRLHSSYTFKIMCIQSDLTIRSINIKETHNKADACQENDISNDNNMEETSVEKVEDDFYSNFKCEICSRVFDTAKNLKSHEFYQHLIDKICTECNKSFDSVDKYVVSFLRWLKFKQSSTIFRLIITKNITANIAIKNTQVLTIYKSIATLTPV